MGNMKDSITESFNKNIITLNGIEYINVDVFQSAVSEVAVLESLLGSIAIKENKNFSVTEEEAIKYITDLNSKVDISYKDNAYNIVLK